jgi:hypothetical protein
MNSLKTACKPHLQNIVKPHKSYSRRNENIVFLTVFKVQSVHKVSLQIQKFFCKANEKTYKWKLLQNET